MPISPIPVSPQRIKAAVMSETSPSGTNVSKGNPIGSLSTEGSDPAANSGVNSFPVSFSQVFSSTVAGIGQRPDEAAAPSAAKANPNFMTQGHQEIPGSTASQLHEIGLFLTPGKALLSNDISPKTLALGQEKGGKDQPESEKTPVNSAGRQSAPDAILGLPLLFFNLAANGPPVVPGLALAVDANRVPNAVGGLYSRSNDSKVKESTTPALAQVGLITDSAPAVTAQVIGTPDALAFQLQLSRNDQAIDSKGSFRPGLTSVGSPPNDSANKEGAGLEISLADLSAGGTSTSSDEPLDNKEPLLGDVQPKSASPQSIPPANVQNLLQNMSISSGDKPSALMNQLNTQAQGVAPVPAQPLQPASTTKLQTSGSNDLIGNSVSQGSKLAVPLPAKEIKTGSSIAAAQAQATAGFGMQPGPNAPAVASESKTLSNSPALPIEEHAVSGTSPVKTDLNVKITGESGETVNLRVSEKGGEVQIAVRASDAATATQIRHELPAVQEGLERAGWHTETASGMSHLPTHNNESSDREPGRQNQQNSRNNPDGQSRQDRRRTPGQNHWATFLNQDI